MKINLNNELQLSKVATGLWRQIEWNYTIEQIHQLLETNHQKGITTIDTADIYGKFEAEAQLGEVFKAYPGFRDKFELVTKTGIIFPSKYGDKFGITIGQYNHTYDYVTNQIKRSVEIMNCGHIDLLLIHRPSPLTDYEELAKALNDVKEQNLVKCFGVSNFLPAHFTALQSKLDQYGIKLITNQVEMSVNHLEHFQNGNVEFFAQHNIKPMIWSPIAGGELFSKPEEHQDMINLLKELQEKYQLQGIDEVMYAWLNTHPLEMCVIAGSSKTERYDSALNGMKIKLSNDDWFRIFVTCQGHGMA